MQRRHPVLLCVAFLAFILPSAEVAAETLPGALKKLDEERIPAGIEAYVAVLKERERRAVAEEAIGLLDGMLDSVQKRIESGVSQLADSLVAEIALKEMQTRLNDIAWRLEEASLDYATLFGEEPGDLARPRVPEDALPQMVEDARAATSDDRRHALARAWIAMRHARKERELLEPMRAFARDLADAATRQYDLGTYGLAGVMELWRQYHSISDREAASAFELLERQLEILRLTGRLKEAR